MCQHGRWLKIYANINGSKDKYIENGISMYRIYGSAHTYSHTRANQPLATGADELFSSQTINAYLITKLINMKNN